MFKNFSELPECVQDFLVSATGPEWAKEAAAKFGLSQEKIVTLLDLAEQPIFQAGGLKNLSATILSELKISQEIANQIAVDLAGNRLLPIAQFLGEDIEGQIRVWGGDPAVFKNVPRVEVVQKDPAEVVAETLKELEIELSDHLEQSRLEFILTSLLNGSRSKEETLAAFVRPVKVGGLNMAETDAKVLLERFLAVSPSPHSPRAGVSPSPLTLPHRGDEGGRTEGGTGGRLMVDIKPPPVRPVLARQAEARLERRPASTPPPPPPPPPPLAPPFVPAPESALTPNPSPSGQELAPLPVVPALEAPHPIVPSPSGQRGVPNSPLSPRQSQPLTPLSPLPRGRGECVETVVRQIEKISGLKFDENKRKKFTTAVEARLKDVRDAFETRDLLERPLDQGGLAIGGGQLVKVMEELERVVGEQKAVARRKTEGEKESARAAKIAAEQIAAEKIKAARPKVAPPKPAVSVVSPASRLIQPSEGRPRMTDIVAPSRRLSGPVDELQNLSLDEFRRLSSDPKEAIIKIHDKINLLEEQGVGQKILAVKAWRSSPVNLLYLEISRAALLAGRTIEEIAREREVAGQASLSGVEIQAINSLNGMLRF